MGISTCSEEEFNQYKNYWKERLLTIRLPEDLNSGMGQYILSQLDEAYALLRIDYAEIESAKDKAESIVRQNERGRAVGKNEDDRKKNATEYLENYPIDDDSINMYEWLRLLSVRYSVVKSFVDIINNKQQRLITMTGLMKIDSSLGSGIHGQGGSD